MRWLAWVVSGVVCVVPSRANAQYISAPVFCDNAAAREEHPDWAERCMSPKERRAPRVYWLAISGIGSLHFNSSNQLNDALRASGYSAPGPVQSIFGAGADGGIDRFRGTWDFGCPGSRSYTRNSDGATFRVQQCYIGLDFGYNIVQRDGLSIFPMLGIAGGDLRLKVDPNRAPFLADQLTAADGDGEIRRNVAAARVLIGVEERLLIWEPERLWLLFGARGGYVQQLGQSNWLHDEPSLPSMRGGPTVNTSGPFLRFGLGLAADTN